MEQAQILDNYQQIKRRISIAARAVGRDPASVKIVVVSKGHSTELVQAAYDAGVRIFGENYVEEAVEKLQALKQPGVEWHMIGHVQSRKARQVSEYFDCLHSLDSEKLARRLDNFSSAFGRQLPVLLECNTSGEATKFGFPVYDETSWESLLPLFQSINRLSNLSLRGLMTMAPFSADPETARPFFRRLREFSLYLKRHLPEASFDELSMGMSADFEVAVEEGATIVRIGTAILGSRRTS